ncbi:MAG TPA: hypothetical protein VJJ23_00730 [Candidatus Nanoarchaeia archaeon]|nr:hypothetical protein [Candidatus Nanoarchaeia archaeon]
MDVSEVIIPGLRMLIVTIAIYIVLIVFLLPLISTGKPYSSPFSWFSVIVLVYSVIVAWFFERLLSKNKKRKWFFE